MLFKKLKAGALYYAILVSFIVALLSGFLILNIWYHHYHTLMLIQNIKLDRNNRSALIIAIESPDLLNINQSKLIDLYSNNDNNNKIILTKKLWGGYYILKAETEWRNIKNSLMELCGSDIKNGESMALYLTDNDRYLSVSGNTILKGNCYLPKTGIRRSDIEGLGFSGDELVNGEIKISDTNLPSIEPLFIESNKFYLSNNKFQLDSVLTFQNFKITDSLYNSFNNKTVLIYSNNWIYLSNNIIKGNIKIVSTKGIKIDKNSKINDVIFYAPKIVIEANFSGQVQLFAKDSIIINEGAKLLFPSFVAILNHDIKNPIIDIHKKSSIAGDILLYSPENSNSILPNCNLENVEFNVL